MWGHLNVCALKHANIGRRFWFWQPSVRKKLTAGFDGGSLSSDGGLLLLREAERRLGITKPGRSDPRLGLSLCKGG